MNKRVRKLAHEAQTVESPVHKRLDWARDAESFVGFKDAAVTM